MVRSALERDTGRCRSWRRCRASPLDLIGKDTLKQLPALLGRADLLVTPDSGPMHIANAMGTKVLGLHAASNPNRSGPYSDRRFCVDRYDDAARIYRGKPASRDFKWGTKIESRRRDGPDHGRGRGGGVRALSRHRGIDQAPAPLP